MFDYSKKDIVEALINAGLKKGDTVFTHSNIGLFGTMENAKSPLDYLEGFLSAFLDCIGNEGTLCLPVFTYSFCNNEVFDPLNTPSNMGALPEYVRCYNNTIRSIDANFSVVALGKDAGKLCSVNNHSFGKNSFWEHLWEANGKICNLNFDASSTFLHYVERRLNVPYRYDKKFSGYIINQNKKEYAEFFHFVRHLDRPDWNMNVEMYHKYALESKLTNAVPLGRGVIYSSCVSDIFSSLKNEISKNPYFLTVSGKS